MKKGKNYYFQTTFLHFYLKGDFCFVFEELGLSEIELKDSKNKKDGIKIKFKQYFILSLFLDFGFIILINHFQIYQR